MLTYQPRLLGTANLGAYTIMRAVIPSSRSRSKSNHLSGVDNHARAGLLGATCRKILPRIIIETYIETNASRSQISWLGRVSLSTRLRVARTSRHDADFMLRALPGPCRQIVATWAVSNTTSALDISGCSEA